MKQCSFDATLIQKNQQTLESSVSFLCLSSRRFKLHLSPQPKQQGQQLVLIGLRETDDPKGSAVGQKNT